MTDRLLSEIRLLYTCEAEYKLPAAPIVRQLIADADRPLPDVLPPKPEWMEFKWPKFGDVDFKGYWKQVDARNAVKVDKGELA